MAERQTRAAFLYLEAKDPRNEGQFAQCARCMMWLGQDKNRCGIHGPDTEVTGTMSCGLYVEGDPMPKQQVHLVVTPDESGLVDRPVRCENCAHFEPQGNQCKLYMALNRVLPQQFDLDTVVAPNGCCNAQTSAGAGWKRALAKTRERF